MKNLNLNSVYLIKQPRKALLSFVFVGETVGIEEPLLPKLYTSLNELGEESDVIFIFPTSTVKKIDPKKFTNLLSGIGWIIGEWKDTLPELFEYTIEIFKKHSGILLLDLRDTSDLPIQSVIELTMSGNLNPVFNIRRKDSDEVFEYYRYFREDKKRGFFEFWKNPDKLKESDGKQDLMNYYSQWKTDSRFILLRLPNISKYLTKKNIMWTFDSYRDCLSSLTKILEMENLNLDLEKINYGAEGTK